MKGVVIINKISSIRTLRNSALFFMAFAMVIAFCGMSVTTAKAEGCAKINYQSHVQSIGWQNWVSNGGASGTSGQSKRLEGMRIALEDVNGGVEYRTHVQNVGWMDWVSNGEVSGTEGRSLRLEAIEIRLTGEAADLYDVYYRVHAQNVGWLGWASNGQSSGTAGLSYRLEAIEIVLADKGNPAPGSTDMPFADRTVIQSTSASYTIYYQGDSQWGFKRSIAKEACLVSSFAVTINNMGIAATPRTVFQSNGNRLSMNTGNLAANFGVQTASALNAGSAYLQGFDGYKTYIADPAANAIPAIKEALDLHPEGVILSFKRGSRAHSIVACKYEGDTIYYSDPGRKTDQLLTFENTWCRCQHRMTYKHLVNIIALDAV